MINTLAHLGRYPINRDVDDALTEISTFEAEWDEQKST